MNNKARPLIMVENVSQSEEQIKSNSSYDCDIIYSEEDEYSNFVSTNKFNNVAVTKSHHRKRKNSLQLQIPRR